MDNVAEGLKRSDKKELIHYLIIAKGSAGEFQSQIYCHLDNGIINKNEANQKLEEAFSLNIKIGGFIKYLKQSDFSGWKLEEPDEPYSHDQADISQP